MASSIALKTPSNIVLQQEFLERSLCSLWSGSKHLSGLDFKQEQISLQQSLNNRRNEETRAFIQALCGLMTSIKTLKKDVSCDETINNKDLSYFEETLRNIEDSLSALKCQINNQTSALQEEEEQLQTVISTLSQRINPSPDSEVKTSSALPIHVGSQISTNSAYNKMHPDIQEFQDFLQKCGGHSGGWTNSDHLLFCKLLQKKKGREFVPALLEQMPDKSEEEVNAHQAWYHRYLVLKQAHRRALSEWKRSRNVRNTERNKDDRPPSPSDLPRIMVDINRSQEVKARIAEWKRQQDEKRREEELRILRQKRKEEEKWKQKMAYFERQRALLLERKKEKETADAAKPLEEGPLSKHLKEVELLEKKLEFSHLTLKDFRDFDDEYLKRRLSRLERNRQRSRRGSRDSSRHRSGSSSTAKRDPTRLLQPTAIWKIRLNRSQSECNDAERQRRRDAHFFINDIPHLGVPDWRKGIA